MVGLTVLVVDRRAHERRDLIEALHRLGAHAVGAHVLTEAVALLDGLAADIVVVRSDEPDVALAYLRSRALLVHLPEHTSLEATLTALLGPLEPHLSN
jgi:AmiR/NasT family two-component response regulator